MQHLILLRHALTEPNPLDDFDRQLTDYGKKQATEIASYFSSNSAFLPTLILCSTATRTRQTALPLVERFEIKINYLPELYNPRAEGIKELISDYQHVDNLMIVSHNPAVSRVVSEFACNRAPGLEPSQMAIFKVTDLNPPESKTDLILFYESI